MNKVEIKYSYITNFGELTINGEKISEYSELNSTLRKSFLESVSSIVEILDKEIYDEYELDIFASKFQCAILKFFAEKSEYCKSIHCFESQSLFQIDELWSRINEICKKNNVQVEMRGLVSVFLGQHRTLKYNELCYVVENADAEIGIFTDIDSVVGNIMIPVIISDKFDIVTESGQNKYFIPENIIEEFIDYYTKENVIKKAIMDGILALKYVELDPISDIEIQSLINNKPMYYLGKCPNTVDKGDRFALEFVSFPQDEYYLWLDNESVLEYYNGEIIAKNEGNATINVCNNGIVVESIKIIVIGHSFIENIVVLPRFEYLKKNERGKLDLLLSPTDAEDVDEITWSTSDGGVIEVDQQGNVFAVSAGNAIITVASRKTKTYFNVEVRTQITEIRISPQSLFIKLGETQVMDTYIYPEKAIVEELRWEIDNTNIAHINPSVNNRRCQVIASNTYIGKGNIRCYDPITKLGAVCNVEVVSNIAPNPLGRLALALTIIGILVPFLLPVSAIISGVGLMIDHEESHKKRFITCFILSMVFLAFWYLLFK